jgi:hypothetical protein
VRHSQKWFVRLLQNTFTLHTYIYPLTMTQGQVQQRFPWHA